MFTILIVVLQVCCMTALRLFGVSYDIEGVSLFFAALALAVLCWDSWSIVRDKKLYLIFIIALGARALLLLVDYYLFPIMHSGGDTESFYRIAVADKELAYSRKIYYAWLAAFFEVIGPARLLAQFINLLCNLFSCLLILQSLRIWKVSRAAQAIGFVFACLLPNWMDMSVILLRESLIGLFVSLMLYLFSLWYQRNCFVYILMAVLAILPAIDLHSGMIALPLTLFAGVLLFNPKNKRIRLNAGTLLFGIAALAGCVVLLSMLNLRKLGDLSFERIAAMVHWGTTNQEGIGSIYLANLTPRTWAEMLLQTPLRMLYFFFSPLPMDFRGVSDVLAFLMSSLPVLAVFGCAAYAVATGRKHRKLLLFLIAMTLAFGAVYAWGTVAAGTAMRHRDKIVPIYAVMLAMSQDALACRKKFGVLPVMATDVLERLNLN